MIWSRGGGSAGKAFLQAGRTADRMAGTGSAEAAFRIRLDALNTIAANGRPEELARHRSRISQLLIAVANHRPDAAVFAFTHLVRQAPDCLETDVDLEVLRAWAGAGPHPVNAAWDALSIVYGPRRTALPERLAVALRGVPPDRLAESFCATVIDRLVALVDDEWRAGSKGGYPATCEPALRLMMVLPVPAAPTQVQDWLCVLGDVAAARNDHEEAAARYRVAAGLDSRPARARIAHGSAMRGEKLLRAGDPAGASAEFRAAVAYAPEPAYRMRLALTDLLTQPANSAIAVERLRELRAAGESPVVTDFWIGVHLFRCNDSQGSLAVLRRVVAAGPEQSSAELTELAAVLVGVLDRDDAVVTRYARELLRRHDSTWAAMSAVGADPLVTAAARTDPGLLAELLGTALDEVQLSAAAADLAARTLLAAAVTSASAGRLTDAAGQTRLAKRMLEV